jgi:hypothetical protein
MDTYLPVTVNMLLGPASDYNPILIEMVDKSTLSIWVKKVTSWPTFRDHLDKSIDTMARTTIEKDPDVDTAVVQMEEL